MEKADVKDYLKNLTAQNIHIPNGHHVSSVKTRDYVFYALFLK